MGRPPNSTLTETVARTDSGSGGMGFVYKAQNLKLDRTVTLGFSPSNLTRNPGLFFG